MKFLKNRISNIVFFLIIGLLFFPKTRQPIQVFLNKGLALFSPSPIQDSKQVKIEDYKWNLKNIDGSIFNFEKAKGKVILVNFWATWCPPCIAEMPSMQLLYEDYKDKVEFVFISNDNSLIIDKFMIKNGYTFKVYNAITKKPNIFNAKTIPKTYLIDKYGNIVIDKTGAANWNSDTVRKTIDKLLLL